jgi:hypothetical protein
MAALLASAAAGDDDEAGDDVDDGVDGAAAEGKAGSKKTKAKKAGAREGIEERLERLNRMARGEADSDDAFSSDDSDDDDGDDAQDADGGDGGDDDGVGIVIDPSAPDLTPAYVPDGSETAVLAAVNLDWDNLQAVDILASLRSFAPPGGSVLRVTVYPSDYGLKKMAEEARFGPAGLFAAGAAAAATAAAAASSSAAAAKPAPAKRGGGGRRGGGGKDGGEEADFDPARLRAYELNKLKYYYAVVECDSVATATAIYTQCDGMEFEARALGRW